jgi:hypothetical protein|tara:strand:+ start:887 stop:1066 length:180 start_codon:yes stop_codon:yes gene_type:complete
MNLNFDELNDIMSQAHKQAEKMMSSLSIDDQEEVNKIVNSTDLTNLDSMSEKLETLKTK